MDIKLRDPKLPSSEEMSARRACSARLYDSWAQLKARLSRWYDSQRIEGWKEDGRVFQQADGSWWSGINPLAQILAWQRVLGGVGEAEWSECARQFDRSSVPVALFVATQGSACDETSLQQMQRMFPTVNRVQFEGAGHSIHNAQGFEAMFDEQVEQVMAAATHAHGVRSNNSRL